MREVIAGFKGYLAIESAELTSVRLDLDLLSDLYLSIYLIGQGCIVGVGMAVSQ